MANPELVQYIKQQLQLGEVQSRIEEILLEAGWTKEDIAEAMAVANPQKPAPAVQTAQPKPVMPVQPAAVVKPVSVSFNAASGFKPVAAVAKPQVQPAVTIKPTATAAVTSVATNPLVNFQPATKPGVTLTPPSHKGWIWGVLGAVIGLVLAAIAVYFYMNSSDVATALQKSKDQASSLDMQIKALTGQVNDLQTQVNTLKADNTDLSLQAEFFASATITPTGATSSPASSAQVREAHIKGVLSLNEKGMYLLTTNKGIVITVKNSKDTKVDAALKPQIGNVVELAGTHAAGSADLTITSVNGLAL